MILRANGHPACDSRIRKSAHPDPTPAKEVYFPFSRPPHPPNTRVYKGLLPGDPLLAWLSPQLRETERARMEQTVKTTGPVGEWGAEHNPCIPLEVGAPGIASVPYLTSANRCFFHRVPSPPQGEWELTHRVSVWEVK